MGVEWFRVAGWVLLAAGIVLAAMGLIILRYAH